MLPSRFLALPPPSPHEVARVLAGTARRITRLLESRAEGDGDALARDEPLLATLASASLRTRIATGPHAGEPWRRLGDRVEPQDGDADPEASQRVPRHGGMSLHADVAVPARDRVVPGPRPTLGPAAGGPEMKEPSAATIAAAVGLQALGGPETPHRHTCPGAPAEPGPPPSRRLDKVFGFPG